MRRLTDTGLRLRRNAVEYATANGVVFGHAALLVVPRGLVSDTHTYADTVSASLRPHYKHSNTDSARANAAASLRRHYKPCAIAQRSIVRSDAGAQRRRYLPATRFHTAFPSRCWPPSTKIVWPVTPSSLSKETTAEATVAGLMDLPRGMQPALSWR